MSANTGFFWWIDTFRLKHGAYYRWSVNVRIEDTQHPDWAGNTGETKHWSVPTLDNSAYVFALRVIS